MSNICCKKDFVKPTYKNGVPNFKYDQEPVKLFEAEDGLLYRLVNKKSTEWAYYNDSKDYDMHVKVTFKEDCDIKPLENTKITPVHDLEPGQVTGRGECVAEVVVPPCSTCLFIKGHVNGFDAKVEAIPFQAGNN